MAKKNRKPRSRPAESTNSPAKGDGGLAQRWAIYCLLLAAVVAVYGQAYKYNFVTWDDPVNVTQNPLFNPVTADSVGQFWSAPFAHLYVPVTYTFFAAEAVIASPTSLDPEVRRRSAQVFHLGNVVLHTVCVLLVFAILRRLVTHDWAAACGALLFALHPLQAESVSWVTEAKGLLCGLFGMLAIWLYLLARAAVVRGDASPDSVASDDTTAEDTSTENASATNTAQTGSQPPNWRAGGLYYAVATLAMALALLSKPLAAAVPLMVIVLELFVLRPRRWSALAATLPWIAMVLAVTFVTSSEQSGEVLPYVTPVEYRPLVAADALGFYMGKLAVPWPLTFDYGRSPSVVIEQGLKSLLWIIPIVLLIIAVIPKDRRIWLASWGLFTAGVLPVLGLVPFAFQFNSTVADRYVYMAMLGPALAVAWWLAGNFSSRVTAAGVVLAVCALLSFWQSAHWRDDVTLYSHGIAANPESNIAHNMLGTAYYERAVKQQAQLRRRGIPISQPVAGRTVAQLIDLAEKHYREAIEIRPDHEKAYGNLGLILLARNQPRQAEYCYRQSIKHNKKSIDGYNGLGFALAKQGRHLEALPIYHRAIKLAEDVPEEYMKVGAVNCYANLALSLETLERYEDAVAAYRRILELSPDNAQAVSRYPLMLARARHFTEAESFCRELLDRNEDDAVVRLSLGRVYLLQGNPNAAIGEFNRVLARSSSYAPAQLRLAEAYDALGDDERSVTHYRAALRNERALGEEMPAALRALAWKLATSADVDVRNGPDAVKAAETANRATGDKDPLFLDTLAAAYATNRRFDLAVNTARRAVERALASEQPDLVEQIRARLDLYQDGKPYVQPDKDTPIGTGPP